MIQLFGQSSHPHLKEDTDNWLAQNKYIYVLRHRKTVDQYISFMTEHCCQIFAQQYFLVELTLYVASLRFAVWMKLVQSTYGL
jgi:hypothetical protein